MPSIRNRRLSEWHRNYDERLTCVEPADVLSISVLGRTRPELVRILHRRSPEAVYAGAVQDGLTVFANWHENPWRQEVSATPQAAR